MSEREGLERRVAGRPEDDTAPSVLVAVVLAGAAVGLSAGLVSLLDLSSGWAGGLYGVVGELTIVLWRKLESRRLQRLRGAPPAPDAG